MWAHTPVQWPWQTPRSVRHWHDLDRWKWRRRNKYITTRQLCTGGTVVDQTLYSCVWKASETRVATAAVKKTKVVTEAMCHLYPCGYCPVSMLFVQKAIIWNDPSHSHRSSMMGLSFTKTTPWQASLVKKAGTISHLNVLLLFSICPSPFVPLTSFFNLCLFLCIYSLSLLMARTPRLGDSAFPTNANEQTEKNTPQSSPFLTSRCFSLAL